jgi:2,3-dihydroxyphenylpropionate 1,2-dioxygenase
MNRVEYVCISHSPLLQDDLPGAPGPVFRAAAASVRAAIAAYDPELVVYFGTEHRRTLTDIVPSFTIGLAAKGYGDWNLPEDAYAVPHDLAMALAESVLADGIDIAFAPNLRLDHGFGLTWKQLLGPFDARPVIPIVVNCAIPPLCAPLRAVALGQAVGRGIRNLKERANRVLVIASGGLSHSPRAVNPQTALLPEAERQATSRGSSIDAGKLIDPAWDRQFLELVSRADLTALGALTTDGIAVAGPGAQEVRTWIAAVAAAASSASAVSYEPVPEWITGMGIATSLAAR